MGPDSLYTILMIYFCCIAIGAFALGAWIF